MIFEFDFKTFLDNAIADAFEIGLYAIACNVESIAHIKHQALVDGRRRHCVFSYEF